MRGRSGGSNNNSNSNSNRKGPNPLTRSYESNGPDVKIRGSAQQIAEKYTTLARDAHSSGDRVMAENYLQHAEHYNRIIAAAQGAVPQNQQRDNRDDLDDEDGDDRDEMEQAAQPQPQSQPQSQPQAQPQAQPQSQPQAQQPRREPRGEGRPRPQAQPQPQADDGSGPQPVIEGTPVEVALEQETMPRGDKDGQANGHVVDGEAEAAPAPRRARRPRRPRNRDGEADKAADAGEGAPADVVEPAQ